MLEEQAIPTVSIDAVRTVPRSGGSAILTDLIHELHGSSPAVRTVVHGDPALFDNWPLSAMADDVVVDPQVRPSLSSLAAWRCWGFESRARTFDAMTALALAPGTRTGTIPLLVYLQQANALRDVRPFNPRNAALHLASRLSLSSAEAVIVQTETMARRTSRAFGLDPAIVFVAPPSLRWMTDSSLAHARPSTSRAEAPTGGDDAVVFVVTSDARHKNLPLTRRVAQRAMRDAPSLAFDLTLAAQDGWPPNCRFLEKLSPAEMIDRYQQCRAVLLTSNEESYGLPPFEASLWGVPVVAVDRPWSRAIDHLDNLVLASDEPGQLLSAIMEAQPVAPRQPMHYSPVADLVVLRTGLGG